jgi:hypothetical protein
MLSDELKGRLYYSFTSTIRVFGWSEAMRIARKLGAAKVVEDLIAGTKHVWAREEMLANREESIAFVQAIIDLEDDDAE